MPPPKDVVLEAIGEHRNTLFFLHGLGDSGHGWEPPLADIQPPHTRVVLPTAPVQPVTMNQMFRMPSWFDIVGSRDRKLETCEGIQESAERICGMLDAAVEAGIPSERIVLGGFSQGGALSLYVGLAYARPLAGIMAISCYLPLPHEMGKRVHDANRATPVLVCHGTEDEMVRYQNARDTVTVLNSFGINNIEFHTSALGHEVDDAVLAHMSNFLRRRFGLPAAGN